jgi:branched-chain amino acid transport system ATP-binding protein
MNPATHDIVFEGTAVTRRFSGIIAVDGVDLTVRRRSVHGLIGPNGAGKTTLLNLIAGVFRVTCGTLRLEDTEITSMSTAQRARRGIRRTFQNLKLFSEMTALDNVAVGMHTQGRCGFFGAVTRSPRHRREEREIYECSFAALEFVGLRAYADTKAGALAYGHRRLLEIARAFVARPSLLLLDEPAAGLNETESAHVTDLISRIRDKGTTVVLVEHHMDVVMTVCDEITVLNYGRRLANGSPGSIQDDPAVIEAYLGRKSETDRARG